MDLATKYTMALQKHDEKLFARKEPDGIIKIYEKSYTYETYDVDGDTIHFLVPSHSFIMAVTDNWSVRGKPVEWGLLPLIQKIKSIDWHNAQSELHRLEEENEKIKKSKERDFANKAEGFASDFRDSFKKTFSDYNVASLKKKDRRKKWQS
jgi:hypothetical protein